MKSNSTYLLLAILLLTSSCVIGADWRVRTATDTRHVLRGESVWAAAGTDLHTWERRETECSDAAGQRSGMLPPLVDLGPGQTYNGQEGGLYPGGSNVRPAAHDAAGQKIARGIVPLDADGNPDPVNGKIVIMPVSVSNGYGAWHLGDAGDDSTSFMTRANANPAKNPKLFIAYGFEYQLPGGNGGTGDPGPDSIFYKSLDQALKEQGVTPLQVQIVWLSMPVSGKSWKTNLPPEARTFPADAKQSKLAWKEIVHAIYTRYPNVKIIYSSTKGAMYMSATATENPEFIGGPIEPFNHDAAWGVKWVIEDQINGAPDLNYDPARGPVKAPWLSWGPYFWSYPDGAPRHYDGLVWSIADVAPDGLHPSLSGLTKYATMLLHQITTDPTATPWFLRPGAPANQPPRIAKAASVAANPVSGATTALSVVGADDGGEPNLTYTWSCSGPAGVTFSPNGPNRAKNTTATFLSAGRYTFQVTIGDAGGLTATSSIVVTVNPPSFSTVSVSPTGASLGVNGTQQVSETGPAQSDVAAPLLDAKVVKFTFGTPTSVTRTGFVKVTVKEVFTPEKGYGFQSAEGLLEYDHGGSEIVRPKDEYTASVYGAYRTTSDLTCALVEGTSDNAFVVALPDGEYTVWLIAGDAECDPPLFEVWANGQKRLDVRIPRRAFVFMEPFQARAENGRLVIELKGRNGWILCGLVIGTEGRELAEVAAKLERDIFFLTEQELPNWKEAKYVPANPPLELTPEEQQRGYVVFPADYTEQIVPAYIPARTAIGKPLTAFAAPGEFEPATLCVSARKDLGNVAVELSDFVGEKGQPGIARENVGVGVVRCWPQRVTGSGGTGEYRVVPEMIEPPVGRASRVQAGRLKQWWLTVHVPPDTPAGRYRMSLTVRPEKAPPVVLEWRLLVLPFQLTRPADKHWGTWLDSFPPVGSLWGPERRGRKAPAEIERLAQADMAGYRAHNFDLALLNYYFGVEENPDGSFTYGLSTLPQDMEYLKQLGSGAPVVICFEYTCRNLEYGFAEPEGKHVPGTFSPKAHKAIVGLVQYIRDEAKRRNWPKIYFFPIDEPGNNKTENRYQFAENVLDFVHEVPGCETAVTVTSGCVQRLGERVDVRIYAYGYYNRDKVLQEAKQGHPFWYYENGMFYAHNTLASRGHPGFEFLRSGAEVATAWGFAATQANPYNDFDGGHKDWNVIFPGVDRPTPTIYWELCREGVDDCRYVATLQQQIQQAKERGAIEAAQRAQRVLEPLLAADALTIDNPLAFGRYRWRIAREILALQGDRERALPFAAVADNPPSPIKLGPNLVDNPSFEDPSEADGSPRGSYHLGYPTAKEKPVGALRVTDEAAHSGRFSLKWDLSIVADAEYKGRDPRWLTVNVGFSSDMVKSLRGKRVKVGYWMRLGGGTTAPGLGLRQNLKAGPGEGFYFRGGVEDPAVWNHFETEGRLSADLESMDIHTWCSIPEAELAKNCFFYIDDVSLEVVEEPPLSVATPLDEYYVGETIPWTVSAASASGEIKIALLAGDRLAEEQMHKAAAGSPGGAFESNGLKPGIYTLQARTGAPPQALQTAQQQIILTPDPWEE